jgi:AcrR family transcriptional regulator
MKDSQRTKKRDTQKKKSILNNAARLFAEQGFDSTTTIQISREAGVTEPLIYYHFTGKEDIFTSILSSAFDNLLFKLDQLANDASAAPLDIITGVFSVHFEIGKEMPNETAVAVRACPGKLKDSAHICTAYVRKWRNRAKSLLTDSLSAGIATGEFHDVPVNETANVLFALTNGLLRQQVQKLERVKGAQEAAVAFCRRSLVK